MYTEYEIFDVVLEDEQDQIYAVSFVNSPAIQANYIALNEQEEIKLSIDSDEKRIITGPVLIPEKLIYREGPKGGYYIKFTSEVIEQLRNRFHLNDYTKSTNLDHKGIELNNNYVIESYILTENLKDNRFSNLPVGTWVMSYKVEDDKTWELTKQGKLKGFSIEAFIATKKTNQTMKEKLQELLSKTIQNFFTKSSNDELETLENEVAVDEPTEVALEDSGLVNETIQEEDAVVETEEVEEENNETRLENMITSLESTIDELNTSLEVLRSENEILKSELSKQKDYSAINLSKVSSGNSVEKNNLFNLTKNYLKNAH